MDHMNGTELHEWAHEDHGNVDPAHNGIDMRRDPTERALIENGRIRDKVHAELAAHAREFQRVFMANRLLVPRPALQTLAEWNADEQYGHEWCLNAARTNEELIAVYQAQLVGYAVTKERLARERILLDDARREIEALREERDTLCAKLDAANAKLAALENAALVAESAPAPADAPDDNVTVALMDERARPPMKLTPPARKPADGDLPDVA